MHAAIHRFSGRKCVMHTQMPHATALTMIYGAGFNTMVSQIAMRFHGRVVQNITYNGFATDAAEGERLARAMEGESGKYDVAFLSNHGVIVCGDRIDSTFTDLYHLERACQLQVISIWNSYCS